MSKMGNKLNLWDELRGKNALLTNEFEHLKIMFAISFKCQKFQTSLLTSWN